MTKKILILFFVYLILFSCNKNKKNDEELNVELYKENELKAEEIKKSDLYGVINVNRLRFRLEPDLNSKTLRFLDKGIIVNVIKKDEKRVKVGEMEDYWYQIEYDGITGWIFGHFIDVYTTYENAQNQAKLYIQPDNEIVKNNSAFYDDDINRNLFFLNKGKIIQVIDGRAGTAKKLKTIANLNVIYYFFANIPNHIYYIATKEEKTFNESGNLYIYDLENDKNILLLNDIYMASFDNEENKSLLVIKIKEKDNKKYWVVMQAKIDNISNIKEISKIRQKRQAENINNDLFLKTLQREKGRLANLSIEPKGRFIYFKPPEENLTYLISVANGEYIQIENDENSMFDIDSYRFVTVNIQEGQDEIPVYSITLKDKYSGMEKEIISSKLYPINFIASPKKNFLVISMIDVNKKDEEYYPSSIYVLSLITYSLMAISTEGYSYQPRWISSFPK